MRQNFSSSQTTALKNHSNRYRIMIQRMSEITDLKRFCILNKKRWYLIPVLMIGVSSAGRYFLVMTLNAGDVYWIILYYIIITLMK